MTRKTCGWFAGLGLVTLGLLGTPGHGGGDKGRWKKALPEEPFKALVEREAKLIQECLKGDDEDKHLRARAGALMIQGYAVTQQKQSAAAEALAALAQDLGKAIRTKGKLADARKLADKLLKPGDYKSEAKRDWRGDLDLFDIMNPLKTVGKGGDGIAPALQVNIRLRGTQNGIEEKIRNLAARKLQEAILEKASKELTLLAYRMAVLGELVHDFPLPKKGKGTLKEWQELSLDMRNAALEVAAAAAKKDAEAVFQASVRLNSTCTQCHSAFRLQ